MIDHFVLICLVKKVFNSKVCASQSTLKQSLHYAFCREDGDNHFFCEDGDKHLFVRTVISSVMMLVIKHLSNMI